MSAMPTMPFECKGPGEETKILVNLSRLWQWIPVHYKIAGETYRAPNSGWFRDEWDAKLGARQQFDYP